MNPNSTLSFDCIYILESLPAGDIKTGLELYDSLKWSNKVRSGLKVTYRIINDKAQFVKNVKEIHEAVLESHIYPVIQIEAHGRADKSGIELSSGELLTWKFLADTFRPVNISTKNNTLVSIASCFGAYMFVSLAPAIASPYWGIIGPRDEIKSETIQKGYKVFYTELLESLDINKALDVLNSSMTNDASFVFFQSDEIFEFVYGIYETENYKPNVLEGRINDVTTKAWSNKQTRLKFSSEKKLRNYIKNRLVKDKEVIKEKYRRQFLCE
jgi:hypothetical protein